MFQNKASLVWLWLGLRVALLMALPANALFEYGDFQHYYNLASWSLPGHCPAHVGGCWPLLDYWYEFPPVFPYLSLALFQLIGGGALPPFHAYAYGLALVMLLADFGSFWLVGRIAERLYSPAIAEAALWAYALMPAPLLLSGWTFDSLTTFWLLLAFWALLTKRDGWVAVAIGLGALTKIIPLLLLPVIWKVRPVRQSLLIGLGVVGVIGVGLAPFAWRAPQVLGASLAAQVSKSSYATVWAIFDGNLATAEGQPITGNFGPDEEHFELARATLPVHQPSRFPSWLIVIVFGALYGAVWWPTTISDNDPYQTLALFGFTWAIFLLWSKGWSPQWQQMLVPLILLLHPGRPGVLLALALALICFLEWPVLLSRGLVWGYWISIPLRTILFAGWAFYLTRILKSNTLRVG